MAYSIGDGVEENKDYSIRWIRSAADRELVMAQLTLGMKFATGDGINKDLETAVSWLHRASLSGSPEAKLQLRKYENHLERLRNPPASYIPDERTQPISTLAVSTLQDGDANESNIEPPSKPQYSNEINSEEEVSFDAVESAT